MSGSEGSVANPRRVTVSMTEKTIARVEKISRAHDDTKTDTVNRAIALYDMLDQIADDGGELFVRHADGRFEQLRVKR